MSGEVVIEAKLPGNKPELITKIRFGQEIDDLSVHEYCQSNKNDVIGNQNFNTTSIIPPHGKFVLAKYIT